MEPAAPARAEIDERFWRRYPQALHPRSISDSESSGLSGAVVWKAATACGDVAVRRHETNADLPTLKAAHADMNRARLHGWTEVPQPLPNNDGETLTHHDGAWRDVCTWQPGAPAKLPIDVRHLRSSMHLIARWHSFWTKDRVGWDDNVIPQNAVERRREAWRGFLRNRWFFWDGGESQEDPLGLEGRVYRAVCARSRLVESRLRALPGLLNGESYVYCHGDLHRDHILFTDGVPTGLIDLSCRWDFAAADLARWLPSVAEQNRWPQAVEWYREKAPLSANAERAIPMLVTTGLVIAAVRWRNWLLVAGRQRRNFPQRELAYRRWQEVVERLERVEL
jgi:Ser/Thr protein kinase RdoA (MazF antagonist)